MLHCIIAWLHCNAGSLSEETHSHSICSRLLPPILASVLTVLKEPVLQCNHAFFIPSSCYITQMFSLTCKKVTECTTR